MFWDYLISLSREDRITIFVSTHFMNEAGWCDRISFMHQGKVLAQDTPEKLVAAQNASNLEEAFIAYLEQAEASKDGKQTTESKQDNNTVKSAFKDSDTNQQSRKRRSKTLNNILAFAARENKELLRDPVRLLFVLLGPVILVVFSSLGITFDVRNIGYAVYDQDQSQISHELIAEFSSSPYFKERAILHSDEDYEAIIKSGKIRLVIEIPPDFGRQLLMQQRPELSFYVDGSMPFSGENVKGYIIGIMTSYAQNMAQQRGLVPEASAQLLSLIHISEPTRLL